MWGGMKGITKRSQRDYKDITNPSNPEPGHLVAHIGPTMESAQLPSSPSSLPANTDNPTFHHRRSEERMFNPSEPSQGTSMSPERSQRNRLSDMGTFSPWVDAYSCSSSTPNIPHPDVHHNPPFLDNSSQLIQSQSLGISQRAYVGRPTLHPNPATNLSRQDLQQSTSLPQTSLSPPLQSQEWPQMALFDPFLRASPPTEATTTSLHRESVDESWPQVTSLPPLE